MDEDDLIDVPNPAHFVASDFGLHALLGAWRRRRAEWAAAATNPQGLDDGRFTVITGHVHVTGPVGEITGQGSASALRSTVREPGTGSMSLEGHGPGVEEQKVTLPELLIPAAIVIVGDKVAEGQLIEAVGLAWLDILKELERDPNFLHQLDWRKVEELIAGAYKRAGWSEVILTPRSGDRGRDIIASKPGVGAIRFYDQVKAYSPGHRVTSDEVGSLLGVLDRDQNVSKAVLTTTADFAPGVHETWKNFIPFRLELKGGPTLREWLLGLGGRAADPSGPKGRSR